MMIVVWVALFLEVVAMAVGGVVGAVSWVAVAAGSAVVVAMTVLLYRNDLVCQVRVRAWRRGIDADAYGSYDSMLFDLRKWTFDQFFPGAEG